jgi:hypothetical protein
MVAKHCHLKLITKDVMQNAGIYSADPSAGHGYTVLACGHSHPNATFGHFNRKTNQINYLHNCLIYNYFLYLITI